MGKTPSTTYVEMVGRAVHSAGDGNKLSRVKIKKYLSDNWNIDTDADSVKESLKLVLNREVESGILVKDKDSFGFSPKGKKVYAKMYGGDDAEDQEESEDDEEDTPSKKKNGKKAADEDTEGAS
ncbi:hypothetical protein JCM8208_006098 [Rhodotorula glutinis]